MNKRTIWHILNDLGLSMEEAKDLFRYLMSEVEEDLYQESQSKMDEFAKECGYNSYADYLERWTFNSPTVEDETIIFPA